MNDVSNIISYSSREYEKTNMSKKIKENLPLIIIAVGIFICLYIFFTVAYPLYIYDTDDWFNISYARHAWPTARIWNPIKVLPETLMAFSAEIGVRLIMPFTGDYIASMAYAFAFVIVLLIVIYIFSFGKVIKEKYGISHGIISFMLIILLLLHFLSFNTHETNNTYLFYGENVTCYFNYIVPALFNAIVVMYLITHHQLKWNDKDRLLNNGLIILGVYLCINSNLFHSVVLMSYIGMKLITSLAGRISSKEKESISRVLKEYIKSNCFELIVSLIWLCSLIMESQGGRAGNNSRFLLRKSFECFLDSISEMRRLFILIAAGVVLSSVIVYIISKIKNKVEKVDQIYCSWLWKNAICIMLTIAYTILLCAKVSPSYIKRPGVMISWMFYLLLLETGAFAYLVKKIPIVVWSLPLVLYVLVFETIIDGRTYANNYWASYSAETVKALDENIIRQIVEAEEAGLEEIDVLVPLTSDEYWPIAIPYASDRIPETLFKHGIIHNKIKIHLRMDQSVNEKFHLN